MLSFSLRSSSLQPSHSLCLPAFSFSLLLGCLQCFLLLLLLLLQPVLPALLLPRLSFCLQALPFFLVCSCLLGLWRVQQELLQGFKQPLSLAFDPLGCQAVFMTYSGLSNNRTEAAGTW